MRRVDRARFAAFRSDEVPHAIPSIMLGPVKSGIRRFQKTGCIAAGIRLVGDDADADGKVVGNR